MVVQHIYQDMAFDSPFLIVYIGTSLFSVFLPLRLGYERCGGRCCHSGRDDGESVHVVIIPWKNDAYSTTTTTTTTTITTTTPRTLCVEQNEHDIVSESICGIFAFSDEHCEPNPSSRTHWCGPCLGGSSERADVNYILTHQDHISMASKVAPLWFLSNYFYALSLKWTTIASSTVLASTGSLFAFLFAAYFGDERATLGKIVGVALCVVGGAATAWTDAGVGGLGQDGVGGYTSGEGRAGDRLRHVRGSLAEGDGASQLALLGDLAGLLSAVGYGAYTVLIRHLCPQDEDRMSMQLMFGYIGLWNMLLLLPIAAWVVVLSSGDIGDQDIPAESSPEQDSQFSLDDNASDAVHTTLTWSILLFLVLKGLLDNVLSDYLWARAVVLTSATVASVGVGLTIPMAFAADAIMGNTDSIRPGEVWGAVLVLLSFVFVNLADLCGETRAEGSDDTTEDCRASEEGNLS